MKRMHKWIRRIIGMVVIIVILTGCQSARPIDQTIEPVTPSVEPLVSEPSAETPVEGSVEASKEEESETNVVEFEVQNKPDEPDFLNPLHQLEDPTIVPISLVMSPSQDVTQSCRISVQLDQEMANLTLILVDEIGEKVMEYKPIPTSDGGSTKIFDGYSRYVFLIDGLEDQHLYTYYLSDGLFYSVPHSFQLPGQHQSTRILVYGDLQGYMAQHYTTFGNRMTEDVSENIDVIAFMGDMVDQGDDVNQWSYFYSALGEVGSTKLISTTIGNHDAYGSRDGYNASFSYPPNGISESTYFYDVPFARIFVLDTESPNDFETQMSWLRNKSAEISQPFKIVLMHRGVYPVFYNEPHIRVWAEVFEDLGIDLVLNGHDHIYSRTSLLEGEISNGDGVVTYVGTGSGSGTKYYDAVEERPWNQVVVDENVPVKILMDVGMNQIQIRTYAFNDGTWGLIDEWVHTK